MTATTLRLANPGPDTVAVEWKVWLGIPTSPPLSLINIGADGSLVLSPGFDFDLGPIDLFLAEALPPGPGYELSCRVLDPVTGALMSVDLNPFTIE